MRKIMLGLVLAALMTAGLGSAAWAEPARRCSTRPPPWRQSLPEVITPMKNCSPV